MKKLLAIAVCLMTLPTLGYAQVYFQFPSAVPVRSDSPAVGAVVGLGERGVAGFGSVGSDDDVLRALVYGRFDINPRADLGLELGIEDFEGRNRLLFGVDTRIAVSPQTGSLPFSLAADFGVGVGTGDDVTTWDLPFGLVASRTIDIGGGQEIVPFGGIYGVVSRIDVGSFSDTDLDGELRTGARWQITRPTSFFVNLNYREDWILFLGLNLDT